MILRVPLGADTLAARPPAFWERIAEMHAAIYRRSADPALVYEPRPGASLEMEYGPAGFSEQGLRGPAAVSQAPGAAARVAVLGDSLVWGELVAAEDSLPARLQGRLGPGYEVLNFGVSGYDTTQELAWYRAKVRGFRPDALVLVFCLNDLMTLSGPLQIYATPTERAAYERERAAFDAAAPVRNETLQRRYLDELTRGPRLRAVLTHLWRWHRLNTFGGYIDEYLLSARDPARVARLEAALAALGAQARADGAAPALVIAPGVYWWHRYPWGELHALARAAGERAGFAVIDPLPAWQRAGLDPARWRFEGDNLHYNAAGNEGLARAVARALPALVGAPQR
jgi:lysophospholipase L1-like esterase